MSSQKNLFAKNKICLLFSPGSRGSVLGEDDRDVAVLARGRGGQGRHPHRDQGAEEPGRETLYG